MSNWNPLGDHVQNMRGDPEHVHVERAKAGRFTTSSALEAFGLADKWQRNGMPFPIYRSYNLEPRPDHPKYNSAEAVFQEIWSIGQKNTAVYWNLSCEVDLTPWLYKLYTDLIDLMMSRNKIIGVVFANPAYLPSWWDAVGNHFAKPEALAFLQKLWSVRHVKNSAGYPAFVWGDHFYTSGKWDAFVNAGAFLKDPQSAFSPKWDTGEYHIDWSIPNWHFNKIQGMKDALGWKWDNVKREWIAKDGVTPTADLPWMIITEELFGSMSQQALLDAYPNWINTPPWNRDVRGYRAHINQWQAWYKQPAGMVLTQMRAMAWKHIYQPLKTVLGTTHFSYGDTGGWSADNVTGDIDYLNSVIEVRLPVPYFDRTTTPPPPQPDPEEPRTPAPDDTRWQPFIATPIGGTARIRARSNTQSAIVGTVAPPNANLFHIPFDALNAAERVLARPDGNYQWHVVKLQSGVIGWMREDVVNLFAVIPDPEPPLLVREIYEQWLGEMKSSLQDSAFVLSEVEAAHALIETQVERLDALKVWEVARRDRTAAQVKLIETILSNMED